MKQNGFILIASLFLLAIMTMIGISMFGGFSTDERMSGNFREKSRAREVAQTALNSAANWMSIAGNTYNGNWVAGATCTAISNTGIVCSNALATPATPSSWTSYVTYDPFAPLSVKVNPLGGKGSYAAIPNYYIQYLGQNSASSAMYLTTASAVGGNAASTSVLQAVYLVTVKSIDIGGS